MNESLKLKSVHGQRLGCTYNHWNLNIVNKGNAEQFTVLEYPDLVQLNIKNPDNTITKDRIIERKTALEDVDKYPQTYFIEEVNVRELIKNDFERSNKINKKNSKTIKQKIKYKDLKAIVNLLKIKDDLMIEDAIEITKLNPLVVETIFNKLINNGDVINLSSKNNIGISTKRNSDYKSLSNSNNRRIFEITWKVIVGLGIILGIIVAIITLYDRFNTPII